MNNSPLTFETDRVIEFLCIVGTGSRLDPIDSKRSGPISPRAQFSPRLLDQYPRTKSSANLESIPDGIANMCFPMDMRLRFESLQNSPLPSFFTFVTCDIKGSHAYGHVLTFYEPISELQAAQLDKDELNQCCENGLKLAFVPRAILIISKFNFPCYREALTELYNLSLSSMSMPIERYVQYLVDCIPLPPSGRLEVIAPFGSKTLRLVRPPKNKRISPLNVNLRPVCECLSPENMLLVYRQLLSENSVIFVSSQLSLLTAAAESFLFLLFPMAWRMPYLPVLPRACLDFLSMPSSFIAGVESSMFFGEVVGSVELPPNGLIVNLDTNTIMLVPDPDASYYSQPPALPASLSNLNEGESTVEVVRERTWYEPFLPRSSSTLMPLTPLVTLALHCALGSLRFSSQSSASSFLSSGATSYFTQQFTRGVRGFLEKEGLQLGLKDQPVTAALLGPPHLPPLPRRAGEKLLARFNRYCTVFHARPADWSVSILPFFDSAFRFAARPQDFDFDSELETAEERIQDKDMKGGAALTASSRSRSGSSMAADREGSTASTGTKPFSDVMGHISPSLAPGTASRASSSSATSRSFLSVSRKKAGMVEELFPKVPSSKSHTFALARSSSSQSQGKLGVGSSRQGHTQLFSLASRSQQQFQPHFEPHFQPMNPVNSVGPPPLRAELEAHSPSAPPLSRSNSNNGVVDSSVKSVNEEVTETNPHLSPARQVIVTGSETSSNASVITTSTPVRLSVSTAASAYDGILRPYSVSDSAQSVPPSATSQTPSRPSFFARFAGAVTPLRFGKSIHSNHGEAEVYFADPLPSLISFSPPQSSSITAGESASSSPAAEPPLPLEKVPADRVISGITNAAPLDTSGSGPGALSALQSIFSPSRQRSVQEPSDLGGSSIVAVTRPAGPAPAMPLPMIRPLPLAQRVPVVFIGGAVRAAFFSFFVSIFRDLEDSVVFPNQQGVMTHAAGGIVIGKTSLPPERPDRIQGALGDVLSFFKKSKQAPRTSEADAQSVSDSESDGGVSAGVTASSESHSKRAVDKLSVSGWQSWRSRTSTSTKDAPLTPLSSSTSVPAPTASSEVADLHSATETVGLGLSELPQGDSITPDKAGALVVPKNVGTRREAALSSFLSNRVIDGLRTHDHSMLLFSPEGGTPLASNFVASGDVIEEEKGETDRPEQDDTVERKDSSEESVENKISRPSAFSETGGLLTSRLFQDDVDIEIEVHEDEADDVVTQVFSASSLSNPSVPLDPNMLPVSDLNANLPKETEESVDNRRNSTSSQPVEREKDKVRRSSLGLKERRQEEKSQLSTKRKPIQMDVVAGLPPALAHFIAQYEVTHTESASKTYSESASFGKDDSGHFEDGQGRTQNKNKGEPFLDERLLLARAPAEARLFMLSVVHTQNFTDFLDTLMFPLPGDYDSIFFSESVLAKRNRSRLSQRKHATPFLSNDADRLSRAFTTSPPPLGSLLKPSFLRTKFYVVDSSSGTDTASSNDAQRKSSGIEVTLEGGRPFFRYERFPLRLDHSLLAQIDHKDIPTFHDMFFVGSGGQGRLAGPNMMRSSSNSASAAAVALLAMGVALDARQKGSLAADDPSPPSEAGETATPALTNPVIEEGDESADSEDLGSQSPRKRLSASPDSDASYNAGDEQASSSHKRRRLGPKDSWNYMLKLLEFLEGNPPSLEELYFNGVTLLFRTEFSSSSHGNASKAAAAGVEEDEFLLPDREMHEMKSAPSGIFQIPPVKRSMEALPTHLRSGSAVFVPTDTVSRSVLGPEEPITPSPVSAVSPRFDLSCLRMKVLRPPPAAEFEGHSQRSEVLLKPLLRPRRGSAPEAEIHDLKQRMDVSPGRTVGQDGDTNSVLSPPQLKFDLSAGMSTPSPTRSTIDFVTTRSPEVVIASEDNDAESSPLTVLVPRRLTPLLQTAEMFLVTPELRTLLEVPPVRMSAEEEIGGNDQYQGLADGFDADFDQDSEHEEDSPEGFDTAEQQSPPPRQRHHLSQQELSEAELEQLFFNQINPSVSSTHDGPVLVIHVPKGFLSALLGAGTPAISASRLGNEVGNQSSRGADALPQLPISLPLPLPPPEASLIITVRDNGNRWSGADSVPNVIPAFVSSMPKGTPVLSKNSPDSSTPSPVQTGQQNPMRIPPGPYPTVSASLSAVLEEVTSGGAPSTTIIEPAPLEAIQFALFFRVLAGHIRAARTRIYKAAYKLAVGAIIRYKMGAINYLPPPRRFDHLLRASQLPSTASAFRLSSAEGSATPAALQVHSDHASITPSTPSTNVTSNTPKTIFSPFTPPSSSQSGRKKRVTDELHFEDLKSAAIEWIESSLSRDLGTFEGIPEKLDRNIVDDDTSAEPYFMSGYERAQAARCARAAVLRHFRVCLALADRVNRRARAQNVPHSDVELEAILAVAAAAAAPLYGFQLLRAGQISGFTGPASLATFLLEESFASSFVDVPSVVLDASPRNPEDRNASEGEAGTGRRAPNGLFSPPPIFSPRSVWSARDAGLYFSRCGWLHSRASSMNPSSLSAELDVHAPAAGFQQGVPRESKARGDAISPKESSESSSLPVFHMGRSTVPRNPLLHELLYGPASGSTGSSSSASSIPRGIRSSGSNDSEISSALSSGTPPILEDPALLALAGIPVDRSKANVPPVKGGKSRKKKNMSTNKASTVSQFPLFLTAPLAPMLSAFTLTTRRQGPSLLDSKSGQNEAEEISQILADFEHLSNELSLSLHRPLPSLLLDPDMDAMLSLVPCSVAYRGVSFIREDGVLLIPPPTAPPVPPRSKKASQRKTTVETEKEEEKRREPVSTALKTAGKAKIVHETATTAGLRQYASPFAHHLDADRKGRRKASVTRSTRPAPNMDPAVLPEKSGVCEGRKCEDTSSMEESSLNNMVAGVFPSAPSAFPASLQQQEHGPSPIDAIRRVEYFKVPTLLPVLSPPPPSTSSSTKSEEIAPQSASAGPEPLLVPLLLRNIPQIRPGSTLELIVRRRRRLQQLEAFSALKDGILALQAVPRTFGALFRLPRQISPLSVNGNPYFFGFQFPSLRHSSSALSAPSVSDDANPRPAPSKGSAAQAIPPVISENSSSTKQTANAELPPAVSLLFHRFPALSISLAASLCPGCKEPLSSAQVSSGWRPLTSSHSKGRAIFGHSTAVPGVHSSTSTGPGSLLRGGVDASTCCPFGCVALQAPLEQSVVGFYKKQLQSLGTGVGSKSSGKDSPVILNGHALLPGINFLPYEWLQLNSQLKSLDRTADAASGGSHCSELEDDSTEVGSIIAGSKFAKFLIPSEVIASATPFRFIPQFEVSYMVSINTHQMDGNSSFGSNLSNRAVQWQMKSFLIDRVPYILLLRELQAFFVNRPQNASLLEEQPTIFWNLILLFSEMRLPADFIVHLCGD